MQCGRCHQPKKLYLAGSCFECSVDHDPNEHADRALTRPEPQLSGEVPERELAQYLDDSDDDPATTKVDPSACVACGEPVESDEAAFGAPHTLIHFFCEERVGDEQEAAVAQAQALIDYGITPGWGCATEGGWTVNESWLARLEAQVKHIERKLALTIQERTWENVSDLEASIRELRHLIPGGER
jgi:hypothetical protein